MKKFILIVLCLALILTGCNYASAYSDDPEEELPLIPETEPLTKELWIPVMLWESGQGDTISTINNVPAMLMNGTYDIATFRGNLPYDYGTLEAAYLVIVPNATDSTVILYSIECVYSRDGENYNANTNTISNESVSATANKHTEYEIQTLFDGMTNDTLFHIRYTTSSSTSTDITGYILGIRLIYTQTEVE